MYSPMQGTTKTLADIMAIVLILGVVVLTFVSIAAIWKFFEVNDVMYKAFFSFSILLIAYIIIVIAARYWETHHPVSDSPMS